MTTKLNKIRHILSGIVPEWLPTQLVVRQRSLNYWCLSLITDDSKTENTSCFLPQYLLWHHRNGFYVFMHILIWKDWCLMECYYNKYIYYAYTLLANWIFLHLIGHTISTLVFTTTPAIVPLPSPIINRHIGRNTPLLHACITLLVLINLPSCE